MTDQLIVIEAHTSCLDASVANCLDRLEDRDRSRLVVLSLFEGAEVSTDMLAVLSMQKQVPARFGNMSTKAWASLLDRIVDMGLLERLSMGCVRPHPALQGHLHRVWRDQAEAAFTEEKEEAEQALINAVASLSRLYQSLIEMGHADRALALIDLQRRTLRRVLGDALTRQHYRLAQYIVQPLNEYWKVRGMMTEANDWAERIRSVVEGEAGVAPEFESDAGALWLFAVGSHANRLINARQLDRAEAIYTEIIRILEESEATSAKQRLGVAFHQLGVVIQERGDLDSAEAWYKKSLMMKETVGDRRGMASSFHQLGMVAQERDNLDSAEVWYT
ncbi:MAG: tetratricopeptide repeat protein, partial [Geminicoccaceae bacterium]